MQYRTDPKSGNELSALGLGCMRFPADALGRIDQEAAERLVLQAVESGVNYLDTAYLYRGSEEALGAVFRAHEGLRDRVFLATKLPHRACTAPEDLDRFLDVQLARLGTDRIDYYLVHNVTDFAQWEDLVALGIEGWTARKKAEGRIGRIGFSFHGPAAHFGRLLDAYGWDFCQIQYNYLNERYQAGTEGLELAAAKGLPVIVMEPLLGGRLAAGLPRKAAAAFEEAEPGSSPASWALRWVWNRPEVTVVLSGMNAPAQIEENCALADRALPRSLSPNELAAVERARAAVAESYRVPCTGCNYCMPCPKGVNIPACFAAYNTSFAHGWMTGVQQYVTSAGAMDERPHWASECVRCGACEHQCPQHIAIPDELDRVRRRLQPFFLPAAVRAGSRLMGARR